MLSVVVSRDSLKSISTAIGMAHRALASPVSKNINQPFPAET